MSELGTVDCWARWEHYAKHNLMPFDIAEAVEDIDQSGWEWDICPEHGLRLTGCGFTTRARHPIRVFLTPKADGFDRWTPADEVGDYVTHWEDCMDWLVLTAYRV